MQAQQESLLEKGSFFVLYLDLLLWVKVIGLFAVKHEWDGGFSLNMHLTEIVYDF